MAPVGLTIPVLPWGPGSRVMVATTGHVSCGVRGRTSGGAADGPSAATHKKPSPYEEPFPYE